MARQQLARLVVGSFTALMLSVAPASAQDGTAPAPAPAAPEQPAAAPAPAPTDVLPAPDAAQPAPATTEPAPAQGTAPSLAPAVDASKLTTIPTLTDEPEARAALPQRLLMDVVSGAAGAAVILLLGWAVAAPLALIPLLVPQQFSNFAPLGIPLTVMFAGGAAAAVVALAVVGGAVLQRVLRPLLGPQPSVLGPILGALFFGGVATVVGGVLAYLAFTAPPEQFKSLRNSLVSDQSISNADGRALALVGFVTVAVAIPAGALAAAIGGPISAEREDVLAEEAAGGKKGGGGPSGGPVRN
jgi:hypothetical protein